MRVLCLSLVAVGLALSGYLLFRHFALVTSLSPVDAGICSTVFGIGCDETLRSPLSDMLGIPLAGWGVVYLGTLAALLGVGWSIGGDLAAETSVVAAGLSILGALGSLALAATFLLGVVPTCPLCLCAHAVNVALAVVLWRVADCSRRRLATTFGTALRYLLGGRVVDPIAARWRFLGYVTVGLVGVLLYQWIYVQKVLHPPAEAPPFVPSVALGLYRLEAAREIPLGPDDAQLGCADAPARLVVFSDLRCPGCRELAKGVPTLEKQFGSGLHVVFKHFPLSTDCNSVMTHDMHPGSCAAALTAQAAHRQDAFWAFHDALFLADLQEEPLEGVARRLGLDVDRLLADRDSAAVAAKLRADVELGQALRISETPAVFLNGRRLHDVRLGAIQFLVAMEIAAAQREADEQPQRR